MFLVTRLPKGPLALAPNHLPTHSNAGEAGLGYFEWLCRRERRQDPPEIYIRTLHPSWLGRLPSPPTQARSRQRPPKRSRRRAKLPQSH